MIVTLSQQLCFLAGNLIELDQHALHGNSTSIPLSGENNGTVASYTELLFLVDLQTSHLQDRTRNVIDAIGDGDDIGLQVWLLTNFFSLFDDFVHSGLGGFVITGLGVLIFRTLSVLYPAATPSVSLLLRLGSFSGRVIGIHAWWRVRLSLIHI